MQILRAIPEDAARLTAIALTAKRHWGYPEHWMWKWIHLLTIEPRTISEQETYTAYVEGEAVGFYSLSHARDRMRLEHLWVLPKAMGRGVGRALFVHAVERARALGFEILEIESDPHAAGFYERLGARHVATTITEVEGQRRELPVLVYEWSCARQ